jgi:integrase
LTNKPLTDAAVRKYAPGPKRRRIRDHGTPSLFLIIEPSGHRAFEMRFRTPGQKGKPGRIGKIRLGPYTSERKLLKDEPELEDIGAQLTLADARLLALKVARERKRGHDVIGDHQARKERQRVEIERRDANSFAAAVAAYIDEKARPNQRSWRWTAQLLGLHYGADGKPEALRDGLVKRWGDRPVASIDRALIKTVIKEARQFGVPGIAPRNKGKSEARARALFTAISSLFSWLVEEDHVETNPCAGMPRPDNAEERDRVLTDAEIRWLWQACEEVDAPRALKAPRPFAPLLKLLLLTGCRLREVSGMRVDELSDDLATWNLPGARTKNKKPHVVPLPSMARELITGVGAKGDLVFSTTGSTPISGFSRMKKRLDKAMLEIAREEKRDAVIKPWRLHDLRRSCATGMAEIGIAPHIVEAVLNHVSGAKAGVAGTYNRAAYATEKKAALERWADHIGGLVKGRPANVVALKTPRKAR